MKIHFLGAARTTTGSMYLLELNGRKVLLECGLFQGRRGESVERNQTFPFDPKELDAAILSHAHIDHCGNLPNLYKQGFTGNIYCTFATRDLAALLLADSAHIQISDTEFVNKLRSKRGEPPVLPLYSVHDAEMVIRQFVAVGYDRPIPVTDGLSVTFVDAGHILGSAQVILDVREEGRRYRYLFSGDVGRGGDPILRDASVVEDVDFLQIESTYGNRDHEARDHDPCAFKEVAETLHQGGKVIIPAFAVGRTQQVVFALKRCMEGKKMPSVPVFVDSPLAVNATEVFRLHPECFNEATYEFLLQEGSPFEMGNLTYIRNVDHSKKLNEMPGAMIIISASGMAEAGRIRHHLRNHLGNSTNLVLFVGFCAEHTLGAQLMAGRNPVNIFGEPVDVRARIVSMDSMSGHADQSELAEYARRIQGQVKRVFVVHGEEEQSLAFAETLRRLRPAAEVMVPVRGQIEEV